MFGQTWYFGLIRKYVTLFGTMFNDVYVQRFKDDGVTVDKLIRVPIQYAKKDKWMTRNLEDPNIDRPYSALLPAMSFEQGDMYYDGKRKLGTTLRLPKVIEDHELMAYEFNPVPYNIPFSLYVYANQLEDANKIVEQILPRFTPNWTVTAQLVPEIGINHDIDVVLNSISMDDTYEGELPDRRVVVYSLNFTLKGYFYGPVRRQGVIKFANTNFYIPTQDNLRDAVGVVTPSERVTVAPGLDANGNPTSNADLSIPRSEIKADDNFGYIIEISELIPE